MLKVVHDAESSNLDGAGRSLLDEIVRDGARQMLAAALRAEVAAYVEGFVDQVMSRGAVWWCATVTTTSATC